MTSSPAFEQPSILPSEVDKLLEFADQLREMKDPLAQLEMIRLIEMQGVEARKEVAKKARSQGINLRAIGGALGITKQRAHQLYGG